MRRRSSYVALALVAIVSCGRGVRDTSQQRNCLVLSVGSFKGVAHLGAIAAVQDANLRIGCVVGNSMGSLIGALYASDPDEDTSELFRDFMDAYVEESRRQGRDSFFGVLLLGAATGGVGLLALPLVTIDPLDHSRVVMVLDAELDHVQIQDLPVPFATFYQAREDAGLVMKAARTGNLAAAVGASIANPLIFKDIRIASAHALDPGGDRAAAVPIEDACRLFPDARLIAVNVTGQPVLYSAEMRCPLVEVQVKTGQVDDLTVAKLGPEFYELVKAGYRETMLALQAAKLVRQLP